MIVAGQRLPILIAAKPGDFRCGHNALALMEQTELKLDPYPGVTMVFRSKRGDRLKILVWDGTGLVLIYKVLEQGSFAWPKVQDGVIRVSRAQYEALFEGLDWRRVVAQRVYAAGCGGMTRRKIFGVVLRGFFSQIG
jgi:transposase